MPARGKAPVTTPPDAAMAMASSGLQPSAPAAPGSAPPLLPPLLPPFPVVAMTHVPSLTTMPVGQLMHAPELSQPVQR